MYWKHGHIKHMMNERELLLKEEKDEEEGI